MRNRLILALVGVCLAAPSVYGQMRVTGNINATQVDSGTFTSISLFPTGTTSSTLALGSDSRFGNATKLNGTDISSLSGVLKLTSGTPAASGYADIVALFSGCGAGTPIPNFNTGACVAAGGTGTVTSVALTSPSIFTVANSPITGSGTLALSYATGLTANQVLGTNGSGAAGLYSITGAMLPNPGASALGGVKSATAATNNFQTGIDTSGNPTFAQPAFSNLSGTATAAQIPTSIPVWTKYTIAYTAAQTAALTNAVTVTTLAANQAVCGVISKTSTAFTGTSITSAGITIGDSNGTATTYAPTSYNLLTAVSNTNFQSNNVVGLASFAGGTIQANFTAVGANLTALTAGSVDIRVCTFYLP